MVATESSHYKYVDIYSLCEFYTDTEGIEFDIKKIDKNKTDAMSRWAILAIEQNLKTHSFFLNNLTQEEVELNFEFKLEDTKG